MCLSNSDATLRKTRHTTIHSPHSISSPHYPSLLPHCNPLHPTTPLFTPALSLSSPNSATLLTPTLPLSSPPLQFCSTGITFPARTKTYQMLHAPCPQTLILLLSILLSLPFQYCTTLTHHPHTPSYNTPAQGLCSVINNSALLTTPQHVAHFIPFHIPLPSCATPLIPPAQHPSYHPA